MRADFVEIGTCDFATELQSARGRVGFSVEPMKEYLDRLPDVETVTKVNAAVSQADGEMYIYYVPQEIIQRHKLPQWIKGCNSVGAPHPGVQRYLIRHGLPSEWIHTRIIQVLSFSSLCDLYDIRQIDFLKIDAEGHDYTILCGLRDAIASGKVQPPFMIRVECNSVTPLPVRNDMLELLKSLNYSITRQTKADIYCMLNGGTQETD